MFSDGVLYFIQSFISGGSLLVKYVKALMILFTGGLKKYVLWQPTLQRYVKYQTVKFD